MIQQATFDSVGALALHMEQVHEQSRVVAMDHWAGGRNTCPDCQCAMEGHDLEQLRTPVRVIEIICTRCHTRFVESNGR